MQMHLHAHSYTLQVRRAVTAGLFMNAAQYSSTEYDAASASDPGTNVYRLLRHIAAGVTLVLPLLRFVLPHGISADVLSLRVIFPDTACHQPAKIFLPSLSPRAHHTSPHPAHLPIPFTRRYNCCMLCIEHSGAAAAVACGGEQRARPDAAGGGRFPRRSSE